MAGEQQPVIDESKIGAAAAAGVANALKPQFDAILQKIAKPPETSEKVWTRGELDAAVAKGQLSQAGADAILERQSETHIQKKIEERVESAIAERAQKGAVGDKMARYKTLVPELADENSAVSKRCGAVYKELIDEGLPANSATALAAVKQVCGDLSALEAAKTSGRRETTEETGGHGGGDADPLPGAPAAMFKGIPNRFRQHYAKGVEKGLYRGWDDPDLKAELDLVRIRYARAN